MAPPKWLSNTASHATGNGKRQKTAPACEDPCCPCSILSSYSERNCPCAKAQRPCQSCDPSHGQCANTVATHNAVIRDANCVHLPRPCLLIPLIVNPAERTGDDNESAPTASPHIQRHIRRDCQSQDGTQSTLSGAFREGDKVAMSPNGDDTSPPNKLPAGNGLVTLQCADCCAPQTQLRPTSGRDSDALMDATLLMDNRPPPAFALSGAPF
jgi:hypothetical protein